MNKKDLSERDICTKFITPSIQTAGWDIANQVREEVGFTDGRIYVRGKLHTRGAQKRADYILYYKPNIPIAVIEAKDNKHSVGAGIQQALGYAKTLEIPFVFSSNGDGFIFHDRTVTSGDIESELDLNSFPSPEVLWEKYKAYKGISEAAAPIVSQEYFADGSGRSPRYYQQIAINRTVEAIAKDEGDHRHLLVMATGTGKTYVAFQLIYRLWKSGIKFLAPYKVIKVTLDIDAEGWRPPKGFKDKDGQEVEDRIYNRTDFDKHIIVEERRQLVAQKITESLRDYTRKNVRTNYTSLDSFLSSWRDADKKRAIVEELEQHGVIFAALQDEVGSAFDPFDLICHVAFEQKPLTRKERADNVKKRNYFTKYGDLARTVLDSLLDKYADDGLLDLENPAIITLDPIKRLGTAPEIVRAFGGKPAYDQAIHELTAYLYESA
ncbi:MAG TPA: hypothetical protein DEA90_01500 [Opitutae bacterium]|nr:hypothetical protein [Puniceicoccaceae bacterium]HBR92822.1 hypothetical protein [Opitutae bacterium]|tara:strand:+ start:4262 stop:5572 length:1311 start_codon:yes stop_codon:yes gene_type:complete